MTSKMEVQMTKKEQERTTDIIPVIVETKDINLYLSECAEKKKKLQIHWA